MPSRTVASLLLVVLAAFGFGSSMFMLPDQGIGIIVLTSIRNDVPGEYAR